VVLCRKNLGADVTNALCGCFLLYMHVLGYCRFFLGVCFFGRMESVSVPEEESWSDFRFPVPEALKGGVMRMLMMQSYNAYYREQYLL